ncbi:MAG: TfoX/Sxy family protein [Planktomarina sp.]
MSVTDEDVAFARDLFSGLGDISTRKMFGGLAVYCDGTIFAMIAFDKIMIKAKNELAQALADEGAEQFSYEGKSGKPATMPYWTLPDAALDDPAEACEWARKSLIQNG